MSAQSSGKRQVHIIESDAEAIEIARRCATDICREAARRDQDATHPAEQLSLLAQSGLLAITVPRAYGGADVSFETVAEVFRLLSAADPSIGQIPQNHFCFVDVINHVGTAAQKELFYSEILAGARFGNANSERGTKHARDLRTRITPLSYGEYRLDGRKYYCTGAVSAQWIPTIALDPEGSVVAIYVPRNAPGVVILDDWSSMGQRGTASSTVEFHDVRVTDMQILPFSKITERPQIWGAAANLSHAAIDVGIARNALEDAAGFVRTHSRPWHEAGLERATDDPHVVLSFGKLATSLHGAEEMLRRAAAALDCARENLCAETAGRASLAVSESKAFAGDLAVAISNELFELAGTRSADSKYGLDRHWRNARTHTLHDPNHWRYIRVGMHTLTGQFPPNTRSN